MPIVVDTHVHVYPEYDVGCLLSDAAARLQALAPGATPAICLTERAGQRVYADWAMLPTVPGTDLPVERVEGRGGVALRIGTASGDLYVLPGRQIATAERLEVLILGRDLELADGTPAADAICAGLDAGAVPVLTWAFGKWWFKRSGMVRALVKHFIPERLWLGDTTMRPREWLRGGIMRRAIANGARVLAGSDPLPGKAEAHHAGGYATLIATPLDPKDPVGSILRGFRVLPPGGHTLGHRCSLPAILRRMAR
jgi:hypothetical protein